MNHSRYIKDFGFYLQDFDRLGYVILRHHIRGVTIQEFLRRNPMVILLKFWPYADEELSYSIRIIVPPGVSRRSQAACFCDYHKGEWFLRKVRKAKERIYLDPEEPHV
jgi:hypothetical protein